ncbi:MAG TPA: transglycosylase SLT domain-containing protein [Myxococcales bacterium]
MVASLALLATLLAAAAPEKGPAVDALSNALARFAARDFDAAADALAPDAKGRRCPDGKAKSPLEPYCALYRAEALFYSGRFAPAAAEFEQARNLDPDGPLAARTLVREGEALLSAGRAADALERLEKAAKDGAAPELRFSLAEAKAATGDQAGALEGYKALYLEFPDHPTARLSKGRLKAAGALSSLTATDLLNRGERLLSAGLPAKALASIHKATTLARTPGEAFRAELNLGKAYVQMKDPERAERVLAGVDVPQAPQALQIEALLALGRLAMGRGDSAKAIARLDEVAARFPKDAAADEAAFLSAWTRFNVGDYAACAKAFAAFVDERGSSPKRAEDGLWYLAFCRRLSGDAAGAEQALIDLEKSRKWSAQALYWRARDAAPKAAEPLYRQAIRRAPTGWYAWLSRRRLAEMGAAGEPLVMTAVDPSPAAPQGEREQRAALLAGLGLLRDASAEMAVAARSIKSPADAQRLGEACAALGLHGRAYAIANQRLWGPAYEKKEPAALGLLFPRAFPKTVEASAEAVGFDPYFVWAIMRRESAFDPLALSTARAFGLMQLLSPTAAKIAHLAGEPDPGLEQLQRPERIVPLGAWYLADLTGRFGQVSLAAAAYNGGPNAVARWVGANGRRPLDEFVELIPYKETRLYVKNVLGDYFTYRTLYSAPGAPLPFDWAVPNAVAGAAF